MQHCGELGSQRWNLHKNRIMTKFVNSSIQYISVLWMFREGREWCGLCDNREVLKLKW